MGRKVCNETRSIWLAKTFALASFCRPDCSQNTSDPRLNELEKKLDVLANRVEAFEVAQNQALNAPAVAQPMEYELTGRAALSAAGQHYPSLKRCEAAKQVLLNDDAQRTAAMAAQGATVIGQPQISCIPL